MVWSWVWLSVLNIFYDIIMLTAQIYDTKNIPLSLNFSANINTYFSLKAKCWLGEGGGGVGGQFPETNNDPNYLIYLLYS